MYAIHRRKVLAFNPSFVSWNSMQLSFPNYTQQIPFIEKTSPVGAEGNFPIQSNPMYNETLYSRDLKRANSEPEDNNFATNADTLMKAVQAKQKPTPKVRQINRVRGKAELDRHIAVAHALSRKGFVCINPSSDKSTSPAANPAARKRYGVLTTILLAIYETAYFYCRELSYKLRKQKNRICTSK